MLLLQIDPFCEQQVRRHQILHCQLIKHSGGFFNFPGSLL